jgi:uncharacterized membrane protein YdjX (TVP38/TMEM64 family)
LRGGALVLAGTALSAAIGYLAGRTLGLSRLVPLVGRRGYRLSRLLLGRSTAEVAVMHLVALASRGSIHLLCGAAPVPPRPFALGTAAGIAPVLLTLGLLAALVRHLVLHPGPVITTVTLGVTVLLALIALRVRMRLLRRTFAASIRGHHEGARYG